MCGGVTVAQRGLYELIQYLQRGTKLHIGVLFFGSFGNARCRLPHAATIHSSPVCTLLKSGGAGFRRCFRCRNMAIRKALETKRAFGGLCSNGVYEYMHPVVIGGEVAAVIFIGNMLVGGEENARLLRQLSTHTHLLSSLERGFTAEDAAAIAQIIDTYIRSLLAMGSDHMGEKKDSLIENVKTYIRESMEFDLGCAHVASVFHYNRNYLGRIFKKEVGLSIAQYLMCVRLERAKELLSHTRLPVAEIASRCGFDGVSYFNRAFKADEGLTPTEYRVGTADPSYALVLDKT